MICLRSRKQELRQWYADLVNMMHERGVEGKGHLQINKNVIIGLTDFAYTNCCVHLNFRFIVQPIIRHCPLLLRLRSKEIRQMNRWKHVRSTLWCHVAETTENG